MIKKELIRQAKKPIPMFLDQADLNGAIKGKTLHVSNLHPGITNEILKTYFSQFGEVSLVNILKQTKEVGKLYGFVEYAVSLRLL